MKPSVVVPDKPLKKLQSFDELPMSRQLQRNLQFCGFTSPTRVQKYVIPYIWQTKSDLIVEVPIGGGTTLAYLLPIVQHIFDLKGRDQRVNSSAPYAIVVAPTYELVSQLASVSDQLTQAMGNVRVAYAHGELKSREILNRGCDILFVTPGRLYQYFLESENKHGDLEYSLCCARRSRSHSRRTSHVLMDLKQQNDISYSDEIVKNFIDYLTKEIKLQFRVLMFSATYRHKSKMRELVVFERSIQIQVRSKKCSNVNPRLIEVVDTEKKIWDLLKLLDELSSKIVVNGVRAIPKTLIFVNEIRTSDRLAATLFDSNFIVKSINSEQKAKQRKRTIAEFNGGVVDILVATDLMSRKVHFEDLVYVIVYDIPPRVARDEFLHRIGRQVNGEKDGQVVIFYDPATDKASARLLDSF
ncbi:ATP-dependent RNA helicase vasa, isoform A, protein [Aphelenchoides besseyi]|nr:ATP-dependent RNA helicase vasa, isoform A, protein [Aphelenchoides besseyi]